MCGITGYIDFKKELTDDIIERMIYTLEHRGPDHFGISTIETEFANVGFAQARLSIIDLSEGGHQPMHFEHLCVVFNGEIYNFKEIRQELEEKGHDFKTNSDTEVILHSIFEWGNDAVHKFIGMFVVCIFDKKAMSFNIIRDRAGVKPIYYCFYDDIFMFGSELKSLMACPSFKKEINKDVLQQYLQYGYIPSPNSIFKDCYKLKAASILKFDLITKGILIKKYWDVNNYYSLPKNKMSYVDIKENLHELLISSCNYRMVADVPVGIFLSGGYDSSGIAAILQSQTSDKLKTFTIGFYEGNNEAPYAKKIAEYLGTDHTELYCTPENAQNIINDLPFYYDEPFADSSAIPTILVSRLASEKVKVALSADGGDELFCGYTVYKDLYNHTKKLDLIPSSLKSFTRALGTRIADNMTFLSLDDQYKLNVYFDSLDKNNLLQAQKLFKYINEKPTSYISNFLKTNENTTYSSPYIIKLDDYRSPLELALATDYQVYLTDDILTKVDRASMSVSIEGREPLLDHRLIEFVAQIPMEYKFDGKSGKVIFKDVIHQYIPLKMMEREKSGFSLPINSWLRGDLKHFLEEYLSLDALKWSGLFNEQFVYTEVEKFKKNEMHYSHLIWYMLMFQMWFKKWM